MVITWLIIFFAIGYSAIIFERYLHINKAAIALVMGSICWLIYFAGAPSNFNTTEFFEKVSDVAQIIFFLLSAMVIVELIDSHHGFKIVTDLLYTSSTRKMVWFLIILSFFMSSVLDNLTSMIVIASLLRKLMPDRHERWFLGSLIVIVVNAGGAWTPIGDVTTTMLWINEKITSWAIIKSLFLPSVVCAAIAGLIGMFYFKKGKSAAPTKLEIPMEPGGKWVFFLGVASLIMIPVWKAVFNLPPFMGALIGVGVLWLFTDIMHFRHGEARWHLRVTHTLSKIDTSGILFFLGILLAIDALAVAGILKSFAVWLQSVIPSEHWVAIVIGLISSVIDNVPLVAASMNMYDNPTDSPFWQMIAYAAGTGGSILIIGSAAGVAFMGMEKIDFLWYLKYISWIALIAYFAGFGAYFLQQAF